MSSPSIADGPASPPNLKPFRNSKRKKLRNGTFIIPSTGERVRRQITLRNSSNFEPPDPSPDHDFDTLLPLSRRTSSFSQAGTFKKALSNTGDVFRDLWGWLQTPTARGILKCSLAYLIGSMATFLPPVANFLGQQDGKHLVATITVYFHPGRSAGSMTQAAMLGICAFFYATFISIASMAVSVFFESRHMIEVAYALVLIGFVGGGLGFVGWFKQAYNSPLVSVACSLASLATITVLTKENAVHSGVFEDEKIVQVMKMVIMGIMSTSAVSLLIWPISARTELRETMIKTTDSFGDMLTMITRGFLSGSETELKSTAFNKAQSKYRMVFKQLTKNLDEAKYEHYVLGTEEEYKLQDDLVHCMQRLAHSIGGLRSAATTQFTLLNEGGSNGGSTPIQTLRNMPQFDGNPFSRPTKSKSDRFGVLTAIEEASEEGSGTDDLGTEDSQTLGRRNTEVSSLLSANIPTVRTPAEIFTRFIIHLGPSMKSLAYTLSQILQELPFGEGPDYAITINAHFKTSLTDALQLYSAARADALKQLYRSKELDKDRAESIEADFEEVAASCGHFSFSLLTFANEMQIFLSIIEDLKEVMDSPDDRSWNWLKFWKTSKPKKVRGFGPAAEEEILRKSSRKAPVTVDLPQLVIERRESRLSQNPQTRQDKKQGFYFGLLHIIRFVTRDDVRFAFKVGIGAALWALIAFVPETRPFYSHWRGEWGLLSYMLVCSMTIGASNTTGIARFIGTFIGAVLAICVWEISGESPYVLAFCGWLVSLPCFYLIVAKGKGPFGRFIMLTYNLSCLYAYSLSVRDSEDDEDEGGVNPMMFEITMHRFVAVTAGVLWGLIITRVIFPISARDKFKDGLSLLWLRMGLIWKRDPLSALTEGESPQTYMNINEEFALHQYVQRLDILRGQAQSEFELTGPFPIKAFGRIMESTSKMLDSFHAMNIVIQKNLNTSDGESTLIKYTADERTRLCSRISHLFQVLASSLKLEFPLNDALPRTTILRDRLLARIFQYRKDVANAGDSVIPAKDEDYELLYAYILVTGQIAEEIEKVEKEVEDLFGVLDEKLLKLQ